MITITKIFRFESAHAIYGYQGSCKNVHGHSYELHVTVKAKQPAEDYLEDLGIVFDFKDLKSIVHSQVVNTLDHKLLLSNAYLEANENKFISDELLMFDVEPTAENILIFARNQIRDALPEHVQLHALKLWETRDAYAEWWA